MRNPKRTIPRTKIVSINSRYEAAGRAACQQVDPYYAHVHVLTDKPTGPTPPDILDHVKRQFEIEFNLRVEMIAFICNRGLYPEYELFIKERGKLAVHEPC